jgi:hypothetical protein
MSFEKSVFVNCPFDEDYKELLRPLLFTILTLGYTPRISIERSDAGETRLDKIRGLIGESKYSIHDLSRVKSGKKGEFYRLNMPFELGIDFGSRKFADAEDKLANKKYLILGEKNYEYMKAISDINGIDIKYHKSDKIEIITAVRDWFVENAEMDILSTLSPQQIYSHFIEFDAYFYDICDAKKYTPDQMKAIPVKEQMAYMGEYINTNIN